MRPLELRLRNFRSYAGEHTFDFRDRTLVGIVGPIGSGKSSLLDAIAFALYGRTPRIGAATKSLINQRSADAGVSLRFSVEGEVWEAARSIRVKGQSKHALYRYEDDDPSLEPVEKYLMEAEVNDRVETLLGLDFAAFERSVLLAQGRFAEFLQARPADRDRVLKGVFGHDRVDRMKELARQRRTEADTKLQQLALQLQRFQDIEVRLGENTADLAKARKRKTQLDDASQALDDLTERIAEIAATMTANQQRLETLEEHAAALPDPAVTARSLGEIEAAERRRLELAEALDASQKALSKAEKVLQEAIQDGEPEQIQRATRLLAAADPQLKAVVEADRRIATSVDLVDKAETGVKEALNALAAAEKVRDDSLGRAVEAAKILEEAAGALDAGRHADMAITLRSRLAEEEACPVCEQPVHEIPELPTESHLDELESVVAAARETKSHVDDDHTAALAALERSKHQVEAARERVAAADVQVRAAQEDAVRVRGDLEETTLQLEKILGPGDPDEHLEARRSAYESLVATRDESQRSNEQVRGKHDQSIRDEQESGKVLQDLGVRLAEMAARLDVALEIGEGAASMGAAAEKLREAWKSATVELQEGLEAGSTELSAKQSERAALLASLGVDGDHRAAGAVVDDRIERLGKLVKKDQAVLEEAAGLYADQEKYAGRAEIFGRIAKDLTDSRFIRFLLDEERSRLAELGSEHFQQLSAGRYRFADDKFGIVDLTAADSTRRADSLSGGETFLASLGLALALAEMVAGTGGRLDSFFLDEGFGTLDPEHLDLAMQGIEQLVAQDSDRVVVIVSHVPELRMRLEDLIELDRNPVTGDTRVLGGTVLDS